MSSFLIKIIALIFMIADHIAVFLLQTDTAIYVMLRIVGRIAAPLFWYSFAIGYKHTSNKDQYKKRLMAFAFLMSIGNQIVNTIFQPTFALSIAKPNMFLTMYISAVAIDAIDMLINKKYLPRKTQTYCLLFAFSCAVISYCFAEYGILAFFSILCFYFIRKDSIKTLLFVVGTTLICILQQNYIQVAMILSVLFINYSNKQKPKIKCKWFFYWFYPIHIWLLVFISFMLRG